MNPAAFGMKVCRYHGARRPETIRRARDHLAWKHGQETLEAKAERSQRLAALRQLEELSFAYGLVKGPRWRGRTFVIAPRDPGVYNWLDTSGNPYGSISMRWQALTHPVVGNNANAVKKVKLAKIADLRKELPTGTKWVSPNERAAQRAERSRLYHLRCLGTPCEVGGRLDRPY